MDQAWNTFSPDNKSDSAPYFDLNEQLSYEKAQASINDHGEYLLNQFELGMYDQGNPEKLEDFNLDNYNFVLPEHQEAQNHLNGLNHRLGHGNHDTPGHHSHTHSHLEDHGHSLNNSPASGHVPGPIEAQSQSQSQVPVQSQNGEFIHMNNESNQPNQPGLGQTQAQTQAQTQGRTPTGSSVPTPSRRPHSLRSHSHNYSSSGSSQNNSTAFPPNSGSLQNTPAMLPNNKYLKDDNQVVSSPVLPSQNDKSFNNQHYYHKISRSKSKEMLEHQPQLQHIRPDVVFTPLVSPYDTPVDSKQKYSNPLQTSFEPLTSPALAAQNDNNNNNNSSGKRRTSSSVFATVDENKPANFKRRTPHGTPIMQGHTSNNNNNNNDGENDFGSTPHSGNGTTNQSRSPSTNNFDQLPEASFKPEANSNSNSSYGTPMLPPQSFKKIDSETNGTTSMNASRTSTSNSTSSTSPQLMGFTMGKLAEQQSRQQEHQSNNMSSYQGSPVLRSRKSSVNSSKSSDTSPYLPANSNGTGFKKEKPPTKKASHKLAEQGRRNRMNTAVQSLGSLIPQSYHDQVEIPSKATTVELASQYIKDLLNEIGRLKQ